MLFRSIYLIKESTQMKLPREETAGKIAHHAALNVPRFNSGIGNSGASGFKNNVPNGPALLLEIALEVGPSGANDINRLSHN